MNDGESRADILIGEAISRGFQLWKKWWFFSLPVTLYVIFSWLEFYPGLLINYLVVAPVCGCIYFLKYRKKKNAPGGNVSEDDQAFIFYSGAWRDVAKNAGLAKKAPARKRTLFEAVAEVTSQPSAGKQVQALMSGPVDDMEVPKLLSIESAPLGYMHTVQLLDGQTPDTFAKQADVLAELWRVRQVRVTRGVPGQVLLTPVIHDPLTEVDSITPENYSHFDASVKSVQIGVLEDGTPWNFPLDVHSIVAGNSGGGKSVAYRAILSQMSLVPELQVIGIDLKRGIELKSWRPRLAVTAKDMDTAIDALHEVWKIAEQRLDFLEDLGLTDMKDYGFSQEMPRIIVLIDECSELFGVGEPDRELAKQGKEAIALVSKMLRLVRAAGITIIMATQRPSTEVVPSGIRELTQNRVAFRMMNSSGAVMALGELPDNSISPVDIAQANKGRAVVADDQGNYSFAQCRFIEPETAKFIAEEHALLTTPLAGLLLKPEVTDEGETIYEGEIV